MPAAPQTTTTIPAAQPPKPTHKNHPPDAKYWFTCPACRAEDRARSAPDFKQLTEEDYERTTFMIPSSDIDRRICEAYLALKYPDAPYITSSLNLETLSGWGDDEQIVVVRRDTWPKAPGASFKRMKDEEGKWETQELPAETFVADVVEMAPIVVRETLVHSKADRFKKAKIDKMPLVRRLAEVMAPPYRPDMPKSDKDTVLYFAFAG